MATIATESQIANIEQSLTAYIQATIVSGLGLPMRFPRGERLDSVVDDNTSQWGEVDYFGLAPATDPMRNTTSFRMEGRFLCNINLFENDDHRRFGHAGVTAYSLTVLADTVAALFAAVATIPIRDYAAVGTPVVGALRVIQQPIPTHIPTPEDISVSQMNISATMRYELEVND